MASPDTRKLIMTLNEFARLPIPRQATVLYRQGVYIGKRRVGIKTVVLYQLEGYYAEVFYIKYRHTIAAISCFSGTARLDPYLARINVEHFV